MASVFRIKQKNSWIFYAGVLLALLPIMIFRDFTPDNELRYLSITDEALRNHDFFAFYNHGLPYADKPPLYFWFLMLCRCIAGQHYMWILSLGSLIPAFGVIAVMDRWTLESDRPTARMMLMTSAYFLGASIILRMDMLMCLFIVLSLYTFWKMYMHREKKRDHWLFPIYLFLALFTKGPLGILIPLCSIIVFLALKKEIRLFTKFWGWLTWGVLLGLCTLWFLGVYADGGTEYLDNLLFHQTFDRAVDSFHHKRPFYYYFVAIWYIIAPWSLYVIGATIADLRRPSLLPPLQQFFITVSLTTLVLLSFISGKLQIYFLPAIPFMVYSAAISLPKYQNCMPAKIALDFPLAVYVLILPALGTMEYFGLIKALGTPFIYDAATILTAGGFYGLIMLWRKGIVTSVKVASVTLLSAVFVVGFALPDFNAGMGYGALCNKAKQISTEENIRNIYVWKIKRPENMDVYLGKDVIIIPDDSIPNLSDLHDGLLLTKKKDAEAIGAQVLDEVGTFALLKMK
ncbi:MAG: dolichyl-phosphate-mannose--protein mannosyltransferase [Muribaculum sp.]|nr:dolichyl-phosphate-mannose--protein mannosyltransferase [Muribaculum sp.]